MNTILEISLALKKLTKDYPNHNRARCLMLNILCKTSVLKITNYTMNFALSPGQTPTCLCLVVLEN